MPCHVSWQFVPIKSETLAHGVGAEFAMLEEAEVGPASAAKASPPRQARAAARSPAATTLKLRMKAFDGNIDHHRGGHVGRQASASATIHLFLSAWRPRHSQRRRRSSISAQARGRIYKQGRERHAGGEQEIGEPEIA